MKPFRMITILSLVALPLGCHSSSSHIDGHTDAGPDTPVDSGPDSTPDTPTDPIADTTPPPPSGYALHEWGVMVMGPDGPSMHGPTPEYGGPIPAKPVIYLYADEPFEMDVAVQFSSGTPTETWPEAPLTPRLLWSGIQVAPGPCSPTPFPSPYEDEELCEACTLSLVVAEDAACVTYGGQVAKLLFYTGSMPEYVPPLEAEAHVFTAEDGSEQVSFSVANDSGRTVEGVWLVYRQTVDSCIDPSACPVVEADIAWSYLGEVGPGEGLGFPVPVQHFEAELDEHGYPVPGSLMLPSEWEDLGEDLEIALQARGLTPSEARAFMNAWDTVFFGLMGSDSVFIEPFYSNGPQVMYFMSREEYDVHLGLETSAPADEVVRVGMVYEQL